jgi:uncharacterized membrane protein YraQ (UPF0718 family)
LIETSRRPQGQSATLAVVIFVILLLAGLFYAKWDPYYHKAFTAAATHTLGSSIISGTAAQPPAPSLSAAWSYFVAYFNDIWVALIVGLVLGAGVQALLPRDWLLHVFSAAGTRSALLAGILAVPSMMCTCCSAPLVAGMRRAKVSNGAALAYWIGNPVLNPATIIFMGFVLGWNWALLRIVMGLLLVAGAAWLGQREDLKDGGLTAEALLASLPAEEKQPDNRLVAWLKALWRLCIGLIPEYVVVVALLGLARAWLFPAISPAVGGSILLLFGLAIAGTLFVIPTAGEVPVLQTLMGYGLSAGSAGALMITLPAISLPSIAMLGAGRAVSWRLLVRVAVLVAVTGIITGFVALLLGL